MARKSRASTVVDVEIGERIRTMRLAKNMSQGVLGKEVGVTFQQIQKYEKGTNRVAGKRARDIARVLGTNISYLFEGLVTPSTMKTEKFPIFAMATSPVGRDIIDLWERLDPHDQAHLRLQAKHLARRQQHEA